MRIPIAADSDKAQQAGTVPSVDELGLTGELRLRAVRGSAWAFGSYFFCNILRFGSNLVLAHVLFPEAFALTALAGILLQALQMFSDVGIEPAIVQHPRGNDPAFLNTAWTIQSLRGVILFLFTVALAWPAAQFYGADQLLWIVPACGLSFITTGLQSTAVYTRARDIDLAAITVLALGETIVKTIITVIWALLYPSVWAMIGGSLVSYILYTIATHTLLGGRRNRFAWDVEAVRYLTRFGRWVLASTAITFFATQIDRLILGRIAPLEVLGVYTIAYMFSRLPADIGVRLAGQVQFPALAEVFRRDPALLGAKLIESRRMILAVSQLGIVNIIIVAPWFFLTLYDNRYAAAATLAPMLCFAIWLAILQVSADRALLAAGDARTLAASNAANLVFTVVGCSIGHTMAGMPGFILGVGIGNLAGHSVVAAVLFLRGVRIVGQDLRYTGLVAVCTLPTVLLPSFQLEQKTLMFTRIGAGLIGSGLSIFCCYRVVGGLARSTLGGVLGKIKAGRAVHRANTSARVL